MRFQVAPGIVLTAYLTPEMDRIADVPPQGILGSMLSVVQDDWEAKSSKVYTPVALYMMVNDLGPIYVIEGHVTNDPQGGGVPDYEIDAVRTLPSGHGVWVWYEHQGLDSLDLEERLEITLLLGLTSEDCTT